VELSFHVPGAGAIPVLLADVRTHPSFRFVPAREDSFDQVCVLFDEIDEWLRTGPVTHGMFWAEPGIWMSSSMLSTWRSSARR
jgi:hypothetical protein